MKRQVFDPRRRAFARATIFGLAAVMAGNVRAETERLFHGAGVITSVDAASGSVTIRHRPIEGLMPAMEMSFAVDPPSLIGAAKKGDAVESGLTGKTYTIKQLKIVGPAGK